MHVQGIVQCPNPKHSNLFLFDQTCMLEDDEFVKQSHEIFYTTLLECLRILSENVVIFSSFFLLKTTLD